MILLSLCLIMLNKRDEEIYMKVVWQKCIKRKDK